jgi:hypothetical protein
MAIKLSRIPSFLSFSAKAHRQTQSNTSAAQLLISMRFEAQELREQVNHHLLQL